MTDPLVTAGPLAPRERLRAYENSYASDRVKVSGF